MTDKSTCDIFLMTVQIFGMQLNRVKREKKENISYPKKQS